MIILPMHVIFVDTPDTFQYMMYINNFVTRRVALMPIRVFRHDVAWINHPICVMHSHCGTSVSTSQPIFTPVFYMTKLIFCNIVYN